jgi:hypothetical protein
MAAMTRNWLLRRTHLADDRANAKVTAASVSTSYAARAMKRVIPALTAGAQTTSSRFLG